MISRLFRTSDLSRERNRVHAQRTRQRKKEQMQGLQGRVNVLKEEQLRLRQAINEHNTVSVLVGLLALNTEQVSASLNATEDPFVEELLRRSVDDIPDASKIPELPALILPGCQTSKKLKTSGNMKEREDLSNLEGVDYELLERDRSQCTPEELDTIRRERNRMHAKRTRDRKRLFTEKLAEMSRMLEEENDALRKYLSKLSSDDHVHERINNQDCGNPVSSDSSVCDTSSENRPSSLVSAVIIQPDVNMSVASASPNLISQDIEKVGRGYCPLSTLLEVAGCLEQCSSLKRKGYPSATGFCIPEYDLNSASEHRNDNVLNTGSGQSSSSARIRISSEIPLSIITRGC